MLLECRQPSACWEKPPAGARRSSKGQEKEEKFLHKKHKDDTRGKRGTALGSADVQTDTLLWIWGQAHIPGQKLSPRWFCIP